MAGIRISKTQLVNIAIQSVKTRQNLSMFWEYVTSARQSNLLSMKDEQIRLMLAEYDLLIYDKGFKQREEEEKLLDHVDLRDPLSTRRSGEWDIENYVRILRGNLPHVPPEVSPDADKKARLLVMKTAQEYGWRIAVSGNMFIHDDLKLTILSGAKVRLIAGPDKRPCLSPAQRDYAGYSADDLVAALMISCILDKDLIEHIQRFWPEYVVRLAEYKKQKEGNNGKASDNP